MKTEKINVQFLSLIYRMMRNLSHSKVETSNFAELVELLDKHLTLTRATFAGFSNFNDAAQPEGQARNL